MPRVVVTGVNLSNGGGGWVEHVVLTLLDRMQPGMADQGVGVMRTLYGQVARARVGCALDGLLETVFLLGRESSVLQRPHRKGGVVLCLIDCEDTSGYLLDCFLGEVG